MEAREHQLLFKAMLIPFLVAIVMGMFELLCGFSAYKEEMSVFDAAYACNDTPLYCYALIVVLCCIFPFAYLVFKENNISLSEAIIQKKYLVMDIVIGCVGACFIVGLELGIQSLLGIPLGDKEVFSDRTVLEMISLGLVSGLLKEIYFRGIPFCILKDKIGEWQAFFLCNILFCMLDWFNIGLSFIYGALWYVIYRKRPRIIVPAIMHGLGNVLWTILYLQL